MIFHIEPEIWSRMSTIRAASPPTSTWARAAQLGGGDDLVADALDQRGRAVGVAGALRRRARSAPPSPASGGGDRGDVAGRCGARRRAAVRLARWRAEPGRRRRSGRGSRPGSAPPPVDSAASSLATTTSWSSGNWSRAPVPVSIDSTGIASVSRIGREATTETHGAAITRVVQRCQNCGVSARGGPRAAAAVGRCGGRRGSPTRPRRRPRRGGRGRGSAPAAGRSRSGSRSRRRPSRPAPSSAGSGCRPSTARPAR